MGGLGDRRIAASAIVTIVAVAFLACGEGRLPANTAARPPGQGWFCWRNSRIRGSSSCQRTKDACEASRKKAVAGKEGEAAALYTDCDAQPSAGCFTHKNGSGGDAWYCAASYDDCESIARTVSRDPEHAAEYDEMSACAAWE
jgi:hypothetical protein